MLERDAKLAEIRRQASSPCRAASRRSPLPQHQQRRGRSVRRDLARRLDADSEIRAARHPERRSRPRRPDRTGARSACPSSSASISAASRGSMPTGTATVRPSPSTQRQLEIEARVPLAEIAEPDLDLIGPCGERHLDFDRLLEIALVAGETGDLLAVHTKKCAAAGGEAEARDLRLRGLDRRARPAFDPGRPEPEAGKIDARAAERKPPARRLEPDRRRRALAPIARREFAPAGIFVRDEVLRPWRGRRPGPSRRTSARRRRRTAPRGVRPSRQWPTLSPERSGMRRHSVPEMI